MDAPAVVGQTIEAEAVLGSPDPAASSGEAPQRTRGGQQGERSGGVIPPASLVTTDDCWFSPFADDASTSREIAFAKIRSRVEGTKMAAEELIA